MTTFKITFFDKNMDVYEVKTYHNVEDQSAMLENIETRIETLELENRVKAEGSNGKDYTRAVNYFLN